MMELYELLMAIVKKAKNSILEEILKNIKTMNESIQMRLYGLIFFVCENILLLISSADRDKLK